jgi:phage FluMu protein Com
MKSTKKPTASAQQQTFPVSDEVFKMVYDSPSSLPGKHKWVTTDSDVRQIEKLLGMPDKTIGAPLWVSGDRKTCPKCKREVNWLDIVSSATKQVHSGAMIAKVVLGEQKFVNTEAPRAIADLSCFKCGTAIEGLRSFKCHNWAYAIGKIKEMVLQMNKVKGKR